jgi:hypothetical protein
VKGGCGPVRAGVGRRSRGDRRDGRARPQ